MAVIRTILLWISAIVAVVLTTSWVMYSRSFDVVNFIVIAFLIVNFIYLLKSRPTIKFSDVLSGASNRLALASLELQYRAREAQAREVEAERRRLAEAEHNQYKLQVAKDMLQHLRPKLPLNQDADAMTRKLARLAPSAYDAALAQLPTPHAVKDLQHMNGRGPAETPVQPVA